MNPFLLLLFGAATLASCQPAAQPADKPVAATVAPGNTEAEARTLVAAYLRTQPNAELYVPDSARVNDNGPTWQVLVPRRDWARRRPNRARFEVNKATGAVQSAPVK